VHHSRALLDTNRFCCLAHWACAAVYRRASCAWKHLEHSAHVGNQTVAPPARCGTAKANLCRHMCCYRCRHQCRRKCQPPCHHKSPAAADVHVASPICPGADMTDNVHSSCWWRSADSHCQAPRQAEVFRTPSSSRCAQHATQLTCVLLPPRRPQPRVQRALQRP